MRFQLFFCLLGLTVVQFSFNSLRDLIPRSPPLKLKITTFIYQALSFS